MGLRGFGWSRNVTSRLDLLRRHLRLSARIFPGMGSCSHSRIISCCGDDLSVAVGGSSDPLSHLSRFWRPPGIAGLYRGLHRRLCRRNSLVVAYG